MNKQSRTVLWTVLSTAAIVALGDVPAFLGLPLSRAATAAPQATTDTTQPRTQDPAQKPTPPARPVRPGRPTVQPGNTPPIAKSPTGTTTRQLGDATTAAAAGASIGQASAESTVIRFEPPILDLGEMTAEISKTASVTVFNITDQPVVISRLVPSCGCTTAKAPTDPIPPGGSVEIPITLKPGPRQGVTLSKRVTFQLEGQPPVVLTVTGNVPEYVSISPDLLTADSENPDSGVVTLKSTDGAPFRITGVLPPVVLDYGDEAKVEHVVHIDWAEWEKAGSPIRVGFTTDHPKAPSLSAMIKRPLRRNPNAVADADAKQNRAADANSALLITAARQGSPERIAAAIAKGADVNGTDRTNGRTALHWAAKEGHLDAVEALMKSGADVNLGDRTGKTALTLAAEGGHADVAKKLLSAGAAVNSRDQIGGSPVLWAAGLGNAETVKLLVDAGADVKVADVNGLTPLLWAAGIGDPKSVEVLLAAKADFNATDLITGDDALMRAARSGKLESMVLLLSAGADVNRKNKVGATPLLIAAASGNLEKVKAIVEHKADLTAKDVRGWNAMDHAKNRIDDQKDAVVAYLQTVMPASATAASGGTGSPGSSN